MPYFSVTQGAVAKGRGKGGTSTKLLAKNAPEHLHVMPCVGKWSTGVTHCWGSRASSAQTLQGSEILYSLLRQIPCASCSLNGDRLPPAFTEGPSDTCTACDPSMGLNPAGVSGSAGAFAADSVFREMQPCTALSQAVSSPCLQKHSQTCQMYQGTGRVSICTWGQERNVEKLSGGEWNPDPGGGCSLQSPLQEKEDLIPP